MIHETKDTSLPFSFPGLDIPENYRPGTIDIDDALRVVTCKPKLTLGSADEVGNSNITWAKVNSVNQRPRSLNADHLGYAWFHQFHQGYILHIPNGFIGDNVIFDHDYYYSFNKWWLGNTWEHYRNIERIQYVPGWVISIAAWGGEAFQHFI